ncbi:MAG: hypothetical protein Q7J68_04455, partial [Thermoplasmata archaeon]|nr:hypothetical protein [Thermoplasmata archaeon]
MDMDTFESEIPGNRIYRAALERLKAEIEMHRMANEHQSVARCLRDMADAYDGLYMLEESGECIGQALEIYKELGDRAGMVKTLDEMEWRVGDNKKKEIEKQKQALLEEMGDKERLIEHLRSVADYELKKQNKPAARSILLRVLNLMDQDDLDGLARLYSYLECTTDDAEEKLHYLEKGFQTKMHGGNRFVKGQYLEETAKVYEEEGMFDIAMKHYNEILDIFDKDDSIVESA